VPAPRPGVGVVRRSKMSSLLRARHLGEQTSRMSEAERRRAACESPLIHEPGIKCGDPQRVERGDQSVLRVQHLSGRTPPQPRAHWRGTDERA
jgi:hypothetical protein